MTTTTTTTTKHGRPAGEIRADILEMIARIEEAEKAAAPLDDSITVRIVEDVDSYSGCLGDVRRYSMDELPELVAVKDHDDFCRFVNWITNGGDDEGGDVFHSDRKYFYFEVYGLRSTNRKDVYREYFDADDVAKYIDYVYTLEDEPELKALFEELAEALNA